jgi:CubicO group peptidase (beta-lactamase class C family)
VGLSTPDRLDRLDAMIERVLQLGRIPGAAIAIATATGIVFAKGYGWRDRESRLPVTTDTVYPIASTSKALNATLIGMLVDDGILKWDKPVLDSLPGFRLGGPVVSAEVTLRDLLSLRTGLPRHDWVWIEQPISRAELVGRLAYLELSAGFRERFQYNNLSATTAGHVAEVVMGQRWEDMVQQRILTPLGMSHTGFTRPAVGDSTESYHENAERVIARTRRLATEVTAPSGGSIHSTVNDMARWISFNLSGGRAEAGQLIRRETLAELQSPHVAARGDASCPTPNAAYGMGWYIDSYNSRLRVMHGGYVHDVHSDVMLFPEQGFGLVTFTNFGFPTMARVINEHASDLILGTEPRHSAEEKLAEYERKIEENRRRKASVSRVANTSPSHGVADYAGLYVHPAYGEIEIMCRDTELTFKRNNLLLPLEHWHYDAWVAQDTGDFHLHVPHAFDRASRMLFDTNADGAIDGVSIRLEPAVAPIRFTRNEVTPA